MTFPEQIPKPESYDTSVPQEWMDRVVKLTGESPYGEIVWSYDDYADGRSSIFGRPYPATLKGLEILQMIALRI